jgi:hypothetical protein
MHVGEGYVQTLWQSELDNPGAKTKIITYNMQSLSRWGLFMVFNGTVLDVTFIWVQAGLIQLLSWLVVGIHRGRLLRMLLVPSAAPAHTSSD